jgi:hypothetical protein
LSARPPIVQNEWSFEFVFADFTGDGRPDLTVSGTLSKKVHFLTGNGDGTFTKTNELSVEASGREILALDFNRDGFLDVVTNVNEPDPRIIVLLGDGTGGFSEPKPVGVIESGTGVCDIVATDLNGDGRPDLLVATTAQDVLVIVNEFEDPALPQTNPNPPSGAPPADPGAQIALPPNPEPSEFVHVTPPISPQQLSPSGVVLSRYDYDRDGTLDLGVADFNSVPPVPSANAILAVATAIAPAVQAAQGTGTTADVSTSPITADRRRFIGSAAAEAELPAEAGESEKAGEEEQAIEAIDAVFDVFDAFLVNALGQDPLLEWF